MTENRDKLLRRGLWALLCANLAFTPGLFGQDDENQENVFELSPFEVQANESDVGYYASSTLAGTRLNSRLSDLAASITVVTAQQLEDTASVDINDVFMYEANTEGTHTYTEFSYDRGSVSERTQMTPETANRVRGIGSPDRAVNYFVSIDSIPFDAYNTERLTINRGPNSVLYGLGSAAGLVNVTPARAEVGGRLGGRVELRYGSYDTFRTSMLVNVPVIEDKLAFKVAGLYQDRGYERDPSYEYTRRGFATMTFKPFEKTTFRASYEKYDTDYRRPNYTTPEDHISVWRDAGMPTYNPSTMEITLNGTSTAIPNASGGGNDNIAEVSNGGLISHPNLTRPAFFINQGEIYLRMQRQLNLENVGSGSGQPEALLATAAQSFDSPLYGLPGISDKSIYDWEEINVYSGNFGMDEAETYELVLEQEVFRNLFVELAVRNEQFHRYSLNAQSGTNSGIYVDVNETLLDGTPNPNFLSPYIETWIPTSWDNDEENMTYRGTAAYTLDFTEREDIFKWLGRHNVMGLVQKRHQEWNNYRWREAVTSTHDWTTDPGVFKSSGPNAQQAFNRVFYLGSNGVINHAPGDMVFRDPGQYYADYPATVGEQWLHTLRGFVTEPIDTGEVDDNGDPILQYRDGDTTWPVEGGRLMGSWVDEQVVGGLILHDALGNLAKTASYSTAIQSYWWEDRIVTTLGWRHDRLESVDLVGPELNEFGLRQDVVAGLNTFAGDWEKVSGDTSTKGVVFHPFDWLSLHYNESDTFSPAPLAQNLFLETLPNPSGEGKDYGFTLSMMDNKLIARVNWYEASQTGARSGISLYTWRARRVELESSWGLVDKIEEDIEMREGLPEGSLDAFNPGDPATAPYLEEISQRSGLATEFLQQDRGFDDNADISSEGLEISLDYNPIPNWNFKFTASRQETINRNVAGATQRWLWGDGSLTDPAPGSRLAIWQSAQFEDENGNMVDWWTTHWPGMPSWGYTPQEWYEGVVQAPLLLEMATEGTPRPQVREWRWAFITNYRFIDGALDGFGVGGSVRWEDKASIGNGLLPNPDGGFFNLYDPDQPIYDEANYYVDAWLSYSTTIFNNRMGLKIQLNIRNLTEDGGLQVIQANPDGSPRAFRIKDPRTYYLTTTLSF